MAFAPAFQSLRHSEAFAGHSAFRGIYPSSGPCEQAGLGNDGIVLDGGMSGMDYEDGRALLGTLPVLPPYRTCRILPSL